MEENSTDTDAKSLEGLYLKGDFEAAKELLIKSKGKYSTGVFHYNLGTMHIKTKEFAIARFHLEKAMKNGFVTTKTLHNLAVTKSHLAVNDLSASTSSYDKVMDVAAGLPSALGTALSLFFVVIILFLFKFKTIKKLKMVLILLVIAAVPFIIQKSYLDQKNYAIALKDVVLREGPSGVYQEVKIIKAGAKFIIGESKNGWLYIEYPLSLSGWASSKNLAVY